MFQLVQSRLNLWFPPVPCGAGCWTAKGTGGWRRAKAAELAGGVEWKGRGTANSVLVITGHAVMFRTFRRFFELRTFQIFLDWDCRLMHFVIVCMIFFLFRPWFGASIGLIWCTIFKPSIGWWIWWDVHLVHLEVSTSLEELQKQRKDNELYQDILAVPG